MFQTSRPTVAAQAGRAQAARTSGAIRTRNASMNRKRVTKRISHFGANETALLGQQTTRRLPGTEKARPRRYYPVDTAEGGTVRTTEEGPFALLSRMAGGWEFRTLTPTRYSSRFTECNRHRPFAIPMPKASLTRSAFVTARSAHGYTSEERARSSGIREKCL